MGSKIKNFIPNEDDNLHCFQACFSMVYESLLNKKMSMEEAESCTNFVKGKPTWPFKGMLSFANAGLFVEHVEDYPIKFFTIDPQKAITSHIQDGDIANQIIELSNLQLEADLAKRCIEHPNISFRIHEPSFEDISIYLDRDCLIIVNVNYYTLLEENDYYGHFVIVEEINKNLVKIQNPGLPAIENQTVSMDLFIKAWHYPNSRMANILAINNTEFSKKI